MSSNASLSFLNTNTSANTSAHFENAAMSGAGARKSKKGSKKAGKKASVKKAGTKKSAGKKFTKLSKKEMVNGRLRTVYLSKAGKKYIKGYVALRK